MTANKINILHLILSLETGGMERFVFEHCSEIDKSIFNVSVCCLDRFGPFYEGLIERGVKVDLLQRNQKQFDIFFPFKLSSYLRKNQVDVIHIHSGAFFYGSVAGFLARIPGIVYTEHGRDIAERKVVFLLNKISSFFADKIITVSADLERYLIDVIKLPARKITTVINGVNTKYFMPRDKSKALLDEFGVDSDCKIIGTVGRLAEIKDQFTLVRAFKIASEKIPDVKLILVGEGPCEKNLKLLVEELELSRDVVFAGCRSDISDILNLLDVFVLPSLSEGTSLSLLEAMASGVPLIATNVGGNVNIVKNGYNGVLVDAKDYESMALAIIDLVNNDDKLNLYRENSLKFVNDNCSLDGNVEAYKNIYLELANKDLRELSYSRERG